MEITVITSLTNPKIKRLAQLRDKARLRNKEGVFIVEGGRMFLELPKEETAELYVTEDFLNFIKDKKKPAEKMECFEGRYEVVSDAVFARISDTVTPQGVLAVVRQRKYGMEDLLTGNISGQKSDRTRKQTFDHTLRQTTGERKVPLLLLVEDLQDPGNLGTIFRTAEAAGASGVIMSKETVDIYNPKAVRSTMGSIFRMPFLYADSLKEIIGEMKRRGIAVYAAALRHSLHYTEADYQKGCGILIGNEGKGLRQETVEAATQAVSIPMQGEVESLNASVSAAVLLYEAARQRNMKKISVK